MPRLRLAAILLCVCTCLAGRDPGWWRQAVFYELCPRSFQDSDGDGVGDLPGLIRRLEYLRDLGVDALWLTPCYPSGQVDFGYDVTDYRAIDPALGTLADFDRLVAEGRRRGIRIVLDLVLNHTSDQHPWFREARSSRASPRRDWYLWRDGREPGQPPCNWQSLFGGPAWTWDPATGQYYYHYFYAQQPDLNWRNPAVLKEMLEVTRWWYRRGAAGFRLDAVDNLLEDPRLADNPLRPGRNPYGDPNMVNLNNFRLPEEHRLLRELRRAADPFGAVLIGETYTASTAELKAYYGAGDELQLPTGHMLASLPELDAPAFRRRIAEVEATGCWPVWVMGNHDLPRAASRYGAGRAPDAVAKLLGALVLTLRGTPILYYGEELGMVGHEPRRPEEVRDPMARRGWPLAVRRDGARTPMQWESGPGAGFTRGTPWLTIPATATTHNVACERGDPGSVLSFYRQLLALRRSHPALRDGDRQPLAPDDPQVLAFLRRAGDRRLLVALNLSPRASPLNPVPPAEAARAKVLLASGVAVPVAGLPAELGPYGVLIAEL